MYKLNKFQSRLREYIKSKLIFAFTKPLLFSYQPNNYLLALFNFSTLFLSPLIVYQRIFTLSIAKGFPYRNIFFPYPFYEINTHPSTTWNKRLKIPTCDARHENFHPLYTILCPLLCPLSTVSILFSMDSGMKWQINDRSLNDRSIYRQIKETVDVEWCWITNRSINDDFPSFQDLFRENIKSWSWSLPQQRARTIGEQDFNYLPCID